MDLDRKLIGFLVLVFVLAAATPAWSQVARGSIGGTVTDASGARSGELEGGLVSKAKWFGWKAAMLIPGSDYMKVLRIRHAMVQATRRLYERYDALIAPLNPIGARPIEPAMERNIEGRPRYRSDLLTLGNLAGLPGVAVPCGFTDNGLPIGLMIVGRPMSDDRILEIARSYQQATLWHLERPSFRE